MLGPDTHGHDLVALTYDEPPAVVCRCGWAASSSGTAEALRRHREHRDEHVLRRDLGGR